MKRLLLILVLLSLAPGLHAQQADSAALVVDHYLQRLNTQALHPDSVLLIESRIYTLGQPDTLLMLRWHQEPQMDRVELWQNGRLGLGCASDGKVHQVYNAQRQAWRLASHDNYLDLFIPYDFRGPLYKWRTLGRTLSYQGLVDYDGHACHRVLVRGRGMRDRYYYFTANDGMLFFIDEQSTSLDEMPESAPQVYWRAISEYIPFGASILVRLEGYQNSEGITLIEHTYRYLPSDPTLFQPK